MLIVNFGLVVGIIGYFIIALLISYIVAVYMIRKTETDLLVTNIITSSLINFTLATLWFFYWFLSFMDVKNELFLTGSYLGLSLFIASEITLVVLIYFRHNKIRQKFNAEKFHVVTSLVKKYAIIGKDYVKDYTLRGNGVARDFAMKTKRLLIKGKDFGKEKLVVLKKIKWLRKLSRH